MSYPEIPQTVLTQASIDQLEAAVAANHRELFVQGAIALQGEVFRHDGLVYTYTPISGVEIPFPVFNGDDTGAQLDALLHNCRQREVGHIGFWSLYPAQPADLGAYLLARGFQPGWWPYWMSLEKEQLRETCSLLAGVTIIPDNHTPIESVPGLPYGEGGAFKPALLKGFPALAQRFIARMGEEVVGQTCLFFTTGRLGIAGMYNVGVVPSHQKQGIGKALVIAACRFAFDRGYHYVMLNANHIGRRTYEQVGFRFIGMGRTWWIVNKNYLTQSISPALTALAEATGKGDIAAMEQAHSALQIAELDQPLPNGMTVMQIAAHFKQHAAAEWLLAHQADCSPLDAWDLGWRERAAGILRTSAVVNRTYLDYRGTLLHVAIDRNDTALAQLALEAGVDIDVQDGQYHATALGWTQHLGRFAIMALIKEKMGDRA